MTSNNNVNAQAIHDFLRNCGPLPLRGDYIAKAILDEHDRAAGVVERSMCDSAEHWRAINEVVMAALSNPSPRVCRLLETLWQEQYSDLLVEVEDLADVMGEDGNSLCLLDCFYTHPIGWGLGDLLLREPDAINRSLERAHSLIGTERAEKEAQAS
jgi:hypothetical protein